MPRSSMPVVLLACVVGCGVATRDVREVGHVAVEPTDVDREPAERAAPDRAADRVAAPAPIAAPAHAYGEMHRCQLERGRVACTGDDQHGQLGRGRIAPLDSSREEVIGIDDAVAICAGSMSSCAVRRSGETWCWGWNVRGQLGAQRAEDGTTLYRSPTPLRAPDAGDSVACTIGGEHACALRAGGTVRCWGSASFGQLGAEEASAGVVDIEGLSGVVELASGAHHACARDGDGSVWCWGNNRSRAAAGVDPVVHAPRRVERLPPLVALEAGGDVSCGRTARGEVWCWGRNDHGQLGRGTAGAPDATPRPVIGIEDAVELSLGRDRACALVRGGRVLCWGQRLYGASALESATPVSIEELTGATHLDDVRGALCALVDGEVRCARAPHPPSEGLL